MKNNTIEIITGDDFFFRKFFFEFFFEFWFLDLWNQKKGAGGGENAKE